MRESTEWCHLRWYNADKPNELPRILLIGDSIVLGYHEVVLRRLRNIANLAVLTTSKAIDDPSLMTETIYAFHGYRYDVVQINNGLHGWHVSDEAYQKHLASYVEQVRQLSPLTTRIWANTTPVTKPNHPTEMESEKNERVIRRNQMAFQVMKDSGVSVHDLYGVVFQRPELRVDDGYHYNDQGQEVLGNAVADVCIRHLGKNGMNS